MSLVSERKQGILKILVTHAELSHSDTLENTKQLFNYSKQVYLRQPAEKNMLRNLINNPCRKRERERLLYLHSS